MESEIKIRGRAARQIKRTIRKERINLLKEKQINSKWSKRKSKENVQ